MHQPSSRAPLAHATLLIVVDRRRLPTVTAAPAEGPEVRLALDVAGAGYGANVALVGRPDVLAQVVADLGTALAGVTP